MGFFDFIGNVCSATIDGFENAASGIRNGVGNAADMAGNVCSAAIDGIENGADFIAENPGTALTVAGLTVASGGLALATAPAIAATAYSDQAGQ